MTKTHLVSSNLKTDWSINFPIKKTCRPTPVCRDGCYARKGRLVMPSSLDRQEVVYQLFKSENPWELARAIGDGYRRKGLTFLRWAGSGDMFPEAVSVLNITAGCYPDTIHWVVTRKQEIVMLVDDLPNIYLMFSLDSSDVSKGRKQQVELLKHPRVYYSFLRQSMDEDTASASIVFNMKQNKKKLSYDNPNICCPVDAGVMPIKGACKKCRMCFSPEVYKVQ